MEVPVKQFIGLGCLVAAVLVFVLGLMFPSNGEVPAVTLKLVITLTIAALVFIVPWGEFIDTVIDIFNPEAAARRERQREDRRISKKLAADAARARIAAGHPVIKGM